MCTGTASAIVLGAVVIYLILDATMEFLSFIHSSHVRRRTMPICEFTTFTTKPGKFAEALTAVLASAAHLNEHIEGATAEVWSNIDGQRNLIQWVVRCDSLAEWERVSVQFRTDEEARKARAPMHEYVDHPQARETHFYRIEG
jgi:hypothetical protein